MLLPSADPEVFNRWTCALPDDPRRNPEKVTLVELLRAYRGKSVADVLTAAIQAHVERSNYNSVAEVVAAMRQLGVTTSVVSANADGVAGMMKRRHWIVHRADRDEQAAPNAPSPLPISRLHLQRWCGSGSFATTP